jgi:hypothetical protein
MDTTPLTLKQPCISFSGRGNEETTMPSQTPTVGVHGDAQSLVRHERVAERSLQLALRGPAPAQSDEERDSGHHHGDDRDGQGHHKGGRCACVRVFVVMVEGHGQLSPEPSGPAGPAGPLGPCAPVVPAGPC